MKTKLYITRLPYPYKVKKPIRIWKTRIDGERAYEIPRLAIYGIDKTYEMALINLIGEVMFVFDEFSSLPVSKLGGASRRWKKYLLKHVGKVKT